MMTTTQRELMKLELLQIIKHHVGKDNAISRSDLHRMIVQRGYPVNDRRMRAAIENLRTMYEAGAWICSDNRGSGYWFAETLEELEVYLRSEHNRGLSIITRTYAQARRAKPELAGQFKI